MYCRKAKSSRRAAVRRADSPPPGAGRAIDGDADDAGRLEPAHDVAARSGEERAARQYEPRRAIGDHGRVAVLGAVAPRQHKRNGDDARAQAAEECNHEFQPGREQQQRAVASLAPRRQARRDGVCALPQLAERQRILLDIALGQEDVGPLVR